MDQAQNMSHQAKAHCIADDSASQQQQQQQKLPSGNICKAWEFTSFAAEGKHGLNIPFRAGRYAQGIFMHDEMVLPILCSLGCPFTFRRTMTLPLRPPEQTECD